MLADAVEFFIGQGCKVGLGGHLMGQKVTEQVAEMRSLPAGIDQRSPARHPDWLGPDDLSLKVQETREATNYEIPIQLKLGAARARTWGSPTTSTSSWPAGSATAATWRSAWRSEPTPSRSGRPR
jgi:glutamate synthase domain-containing protein 2